MAKILIFFLCLVIASCARAAAGVSTDDITLKDYIDARVNAEVTARMAADAATALATTVHSTDMDRRLEDMNRLREQITAERGMYVTKEDHQLLVDRLDKLEVWRGNIEGRELTMAGLLLLLNGVFSGGLWLFPRHGPHRRSE